MRTILMLGLMAASLISQQRNQAEIDLQAAIRTETVSGDLNAAIRQYNAIVSRYGQSRGVAAQALLHMAECYQKLGDAQSRKIYERVVRDYTDQKDAVTIARGQLGGTSTIGKRLLCTQCGDYETTTTIDGRWLAFTDYNTGDVAIRDMATGQIKHLMAKTATEEPGTYVEEPVLSPDLKQVAYLWQTGAGNTTAPTQLRVMAKDSGAKPRVLVSSDAENKYYEPVGWSPDGKSILANLGKTDGTSQLAWVAANDGAVRVIKSLGRRVRGSGTTDPKVSPDGRYIAYAAHAANPPNEDVHIYVLASDGSSEAEVVKTAGRNKSPLWAPDGKHLLFLSDRTGSFALWSIAVENGKAAGAPVLLHSNFGSDADWVWPIGVTRAGSYEYLQERDDLEQISVAQIDSAGRRVQNQDRTAESFTGVAPAWSPDGKSIAFKRHHPGSTNAYDLVVHSIDTGDEKTFPTPLGSTRRGPPLWLHDGNAILTGLIGQQQAEPALYRVDLASGQWKKIPLAPADLSADERIRYFIRAGAIVAFDLTTGAEKEILPADRQEPWASLALSPDGRTLALWRSDSRTRKTYLATIGIDGINFREIYATNLSLSVGTGLAQLAWTRDGRTILFDRPQEDQANISSPSISWPRRIMRIPAQGGTPEFTGIEAEGMLSMDVSPDGSRIAYSASKHIYELWSLDTLLAGLK